MAVLCLIHASLPLFAVMCLQGIYPNRVLLDAYVNSLYTCSFFFSLAFDLCLSSILLTEDFFNGISVHFLSMISFCV